jgi:hypothetical protein
MSKAKKNWEDFGHCTLLQVGHPTESHSSSVHKRRMISLDFLEHPPMVTIEFAST